ncbi:mucin-binding protein [Secundilactobacillus folii]|uniref:mucin-binding protein n=1 Tax=Secundilactobacillus folii TaxID=2678357 RepID=UPI00156675CC|nr:KxYKxGKxW signal peptide domain-containing protein [Secundilactobacillus folii]
MVGKNNRIRTIKNNSKEHYKAYKVGKRWVYASLASFALGASLLFGFNLNVQADTTATETEAQSSSVSNEPSQVSNQKNAVLKTVPSVAGQSDANQVSDATTSKESAQVASKPAENANTSKTSSSAAASVTKAATKADSTTITSTQETNSDQNGSANTASASNQTSSANAEQTVSKQANTKQSSAAQEASNQTSTTKTNSNQTTATPSSVLQSTSNQSNADHQTATQVDTTPVSVAQSGASQTQAPLTADVQTLIDPSSVDITNAENKALQVYAQTLRPQEVDSLGDPTADATLTLSSKTVESGTDITNLTATLTVTAKAGDKYVIVVPSDELVSFDSVEPLPADVGTTTTVTSADNLSTTITDVFKTPSITTQRIQFAIVPGVSAPLTHMDKEVTQTITWSENGVDQTPVSFVEKLVPSIKITPVQMVSPDPKEVSKVVPGQNYVFETTISEDSGMPNASFGTGMVNALFNYGGTTVTIPVPADFKLDAADTKLIDGFGDQTSITQPGGVGTAIILSVPAGSGMQYKDNYGQTIPYKFIGSFNVTQPETDTDYSASSGTSLSQIVNPDGSQVTASADAWKVSILGVNSGGTSIGDPEVVVTAKAAYNEESISLDNDSTNDSINLTNFGFQLNSITDTSGAQLSFKIPDGLNVTSMEVPKSGVSPYQYLPGTTSYGYTVTLADGSTETGTVAEGGIIKPTNASPIRSVVLTPNYLAAAAYSGTSFGTYGNVSHTYDDGSAVKIGDALTSSVSLTFADGQNAASASTTQTVTGVYSVAPAGYTQLSSAPGAADAGFMWIRSGDYGQKTDQIIEPTFYYVLPTSMAATSVTALPSAKISSFKSDDGHTVIKIDYSGTGTVINTADDKANATVYLANNPDALPGDYSFYMYIVSPQTPLLNPEKVVDTSYTEGNANAYLLEYGSGSWPIVTASSFYNTSLAQGNSNPDPVKAATSDDKGDPTLSFYDDVVYTSTAADAKNSKAAVAINLPTLGDSSGSQYTFNLNGPITVPTNYTIPGGAAGTGDPMSTTVLYSTEPQTITGNETAPDETGYVPASEVTDWTAIRSVIVKVSNIKANSETGRIQLTGTTADDFHLDTGKIGYLQTAFYGDNSKVSVTAKSDEPSLEITGTSTIKARYHYVDANSHNRYIYLDDLSQSATDGQGKFNNIYPTTATGFSATDQALVPKGYLLVTDDSGNVTPTIMSSPATKYHDSVTPTFGSTVNYTFDGAAVQYELAAQVSATAEYVDDDANGAIVGTPVTISGESGKSASWNLGSVPTGYVLAAPSTTTSGTYTFTNGDNQKIEIHLKHHVSTTNKTTTRTINYVVNDSKFSGTVPASQIQTINWTITTDEVTHQTTVVPAEASYAGVVSPIIAGYTPDQLAVPVQTFNQTTASNLPNDSTVTVTYSAAPQTAVTQFVDDDAGGAVVGTLGNLTGHTDGTANWDTANQIPAGYALAPGQAASGTYTFTAAQNQTVKIHLVHQQTKTTATTTRTINYVVNDPHYTGTVPASQIQTINWQVTTDNVTREGTAVPDGGYAAVTAVPVITGYTPDQKSVPALSYGSLSANDVPRNVIVTVTYTAADQTAVAQFVDDDNDGAVVGKLADLSGQTNSTADWNTADKIPAGYVLAPNQAASGTYTFTADQNQTIDIHLIHGTTIGSATTTRTITYILADGDKSKTPSPVVETMNWRTVKDNVTGSTYATPLNDYAAVPNPVVPGYTAHTPGNEVPELSAGPMLVSQLGQMNSNRIVIYTADKLTVTYTYVNTVTGEPIKTVTITGNTDDPITVPDLPGYTIDRTGLPTQFESGLTHFDVPATPIPVNNGGGNPGTTTGTPQPGTATGTPGTTGQTTVPVQPGGPMTTTHSNDRSTVPGQGKGSGTSKSVDTTTTTAPATVKLNARTSASRTTATHVEANAVVAKSSRKQTANQGQLPQTNEQSDQAATLSILGLMTGMLSVLGIKRRKRHDDD